MKQSGVIRYTSDFDELYFVEWFRRSAKHQTRRVAAPESGGCGRHISLCTVSMNRLHDLRRTLPENLLANLAYQNGEVILLDYGSTDGTGDWVRRELADFLASGRLVYGRVEAPAFRYNHSRNICFRMSGGEVVANMDADNFCGSNYLAKLDHAFSVATEKLLVVPDGFLQPDMSTLGLRGRFALYRKDLLALGGFDEGLDPFFGQDDASLALRAMLAGFTLVGLPGDIRRIGTTVNDKMVHLEDRWSMSEMLQRNTRITRERLARCGIRANRS